MSMKFLKTLFCIFSFLAVTQISYSQVDGCTFVVQEQGFDYTLDIELEIADATLTQMGTTCNVTLTVDFDLILNVVSAPFGPIFFINIDPLCVGAQNSVNTTLPNPPASGSIAIGSYAFPNTQCSALTLNCPVVVSLAGGGGLGENNTPCGTLTMGCARSVF